MNEELLPYGGNSVAICVVGSSTDPQHPPTTADSSSTTTTTTFVANDNKDQPSKLSKKLSNISAISDNFNSFINSAVGAAIVVSNNSGPASSAASASAQQPSRRTSLVIGRNRKKSRRLTLTQVCSEFERPQQPIPQPSSDPPSSIVAVGDYEHLPVSRTSSLISFASVSSSSTAISSMSSSSSSSPKSLSQRSSTSSSQRSSISSASAHPERKLNRIFSILHSMQQTFLQAQPFAAAQAQQTQTAGGGGHNGPATPPSPSSQMSEPQYIVMVPPRSTSVTTVHSDACKSSGHGQSLRHHQLRQAPSRQHIYGMGRSQESLALAQPGPGSGVNSHPNHLAMGAIDRNRRFGSANSWTGSQCSGFTCTTVTTSTEGTLSGSPLVHAMPYHKDGWTSFFIAGSSTYAQLLIVVCIVAALSEVVTHNVPFLYFEGFFTYMYSVSILFFLYVFGYLLRSKRRREQKKRLRKLNKLRRTQMSSGGGPGPSGHQDHEKDIGISGSSYRSNRSASVAMESETMASTSTLNRFITSIRSQRRRFSRAGPDGVNNLALEIGTDVGGIESPAGSKPAGHHHHPSSSGSSSSSKNLQWTPSSVGFNLVDESPSEIVSYAMNSDNVVIPSGEITGTRTHGGGGGKIKKLKVSNNEHSHGSFFLRAGAVAFGLGTMIYDGLEFGAFLEVPPDSPCFALLRGLNPVLHAAFVFLQMYFIFISARLNIHKFKAIARFGLMHCLATNVCVWIRTLVRESLKEINHHHEHHPKGAEQLQMVAQQQQMAASSAATAADTQAFLHHMAEAVAAAVGSEEDGSSSVYEFGI